MQQLDINKTIKLLEKYKFPFSKSKLAFAPDQAVKIAKEIGFPIVMKIASKDIIHKSDLGCVETNIKDEKQVEGAFEKITKKAKKKKAKVEGVLIQKQEQGKEVIIGMKRDPQFGPVVVFGLGGIFVEILKDTSLRILPIDKNQAEEMIKEIKSYKILEGIRGEKPVNINKLIDIIIKTSKLAEDKKILELDFNPVIINEKTATIVDARIMIE
jgi:acetyl-CoA synthetase (ADP-forming)